MSNTSDIQKLVQAFFEALELRHLDQCDTALTQLWSCSQTQPAAEPWAAYCAGILANERDHDWAEAERIFTRLLPTTLDLALRGRVLRALGLTYDYQGRWADAIHIYEQSLPVFTELGQPIEQAKVWKQIAISYRNGFAQGDLGVESLDRAIKYCRLALDVLMSVVDPPADVAWLTGSVWNTLGLAYMNLGELDQAITCYLQDLAICRSLDDQYGIGASYMNLGEVYQRRGRGSWPAALEMYEQALQVIRGFQDRLLETDVLANLASLHQEMGEYESALGYYAQSIAIIEELRSAVSSEAARAGFFATVADIYANVVLLCVQMDRAALAFDYVERARSRAFLDMLAAGSPDMPRTIEAAPMTLAEVQAALPKNTLLLEYFTTGLIEAADGAVAPPNTQRHRFPPARTMVFVVALDSVQVHDLGIPPNDLRPSQMDSVVERHFLAPAVRRALYDRLLAPIAPLLAGQQCIYLVPHGPLHYIPFQALLAPNGTTLLRADGPQLVYAPSATVLFRYRRPQHPGADESCLAIGYNGIGASRLRFGEEEARSIARALDGQMLIGPAPKKALIYAEAAHYRMLHFSCHGMFNPDEPLRSALQIAPGEELTALDILDHLHLRCDLVTLSACESGLSRVRRGDELIGLVRAFTYAGAPALICSLWRVDERSTRLLMGRFYQEVQAGVGFAEALQRAQIYLRSLTHQQALDALLRMMADEILNSSTSTSAATSRAPAQTTLVRRARSYLKSVSAKGPSTAVGAPAGAIENELIFADPYYWAAFILIGTKTDVLAGWSLAGAEDR
jgi:CHAT domain-containing protein/tetratricopeptide (TPR) repeat protein